MLEWRNIYQSLHFSHKLFVILYTLSRVNMICKFIFENEIKNSNDNEGDDFNG